MPVDKFALRAKDNSVTTIIQPLKYYDIGLDDLENVDGFNVQGTKNKVYGFKLSDRGVYTRKEIGEGGKVATSINDLADIEGFDDKGDKTVTYGFYFKDGIYKRIEINARDILDNSIKNQPVKLILIEKDLDYQWITLPLYHDWDVDFKLTMGKVKTDGTNQELLRLLNSGRMFLALKPSDKSNPINLARYHGGYALKSAKGELGLNGEFREDVNILKEPKLGHTIIIEGFTKESKPEYSNLLTGLQIRWNKKDENKTFKIVIRIGKDDHIINSSIGALDIDIHQDLIRLKNIFIEMFNVYLERIRFTTKPITDYEIEYLDWTGEP